MKKKSQCKILTVATTALILTTSVSFYTVESQAYYNDEGHVSINSQADVMKSPVNLVVSNKRVGETDLSWKASPSSYVSGYKVLRSNSMYGPWDNLADVDASTTTYIDKTSGANSWIYRVEATHRNWVSVSAGFEAPPAVGTYFYDSFKTDLGPLDGRRTEDGSSTWRVWSGEIAVRENGQWDPAVFANSVGDSPSVGVVRTPTQNAHVFIKDLDGSEGFVLRGKDPDNYIYAGGKMGGTSTDASFEIVEMRDGVRNVLFSGSTETANRDMRVEINNTTIKVFIDAREGVPNSGTIFAQRQTTFLLDDPDATYFGIGFTDVKNGITGFTFEAK